MTRRCIQLKLHCFNFSFEDSQLITECQNCLNCLFHQARCLWMRKCLQIICSRYVALISGICSESTKSHSPEEQVFIRMNSSQNEEKSHKYRTGISQSLFMFSWDAHSEHHFLERIWQNYLSSSRLSYAHIFHLRIKEGQLCYIWAVFLQFQLCLFGTCFS